MVKGIADKFSNQNGVHAPQKDSRDRKLRKACRDFEAIFTYQLLKSMRRTIDKCDLFHGGQGEEIYESLFDLELSKQMAGMGPNSLSRMLYHQLKRARPDSAPGEGKEQVKPDNRLKLRDKIRLK